MTELDRAPWYVAGPLFGLLIVGLRAALNKPFGALGGYIDLATARTSRQAGFRIPMLGMLARRRAARATMAPIAVEAPGTTGL